MGVQVTVPLCGKGHCAEWARKQCWEPEQAGEGGSGGEQKLPHHVARAHL